ncbi:5-hydroxytryptamine receptor 1B-like [Dreissena polymorpha]|uniref:5-hydroxytryptamine receptor 1B-like n=1 Tax=Dreissena polymorpha TaxID=45954 RepID=UPI002264E917|nr:5-hydroxytryptamine receptor 1B-like [Dreissena polymorpha]XP_052222962.1 5-hydroxytryptamine receptor 1B-like [Dreissena polymorpha]
MTLAVNAYDRYTAIMNPLEYILIMTPRRIAVLVLICWIFSSFICWAPFVIGWYTSVPGEEEHHYNQLHKNARILFTGAIFVPSCILIVFFYWRMFLIARHHARAIAAVEHSVRRSLEARFVRKDTKYAKTIAVLIGVFLCCWLPFQICIVVDITHQVSSHRWLHNYLMLLAFLNSGVNPWVYAYKSVDFRSAYKNIFRLLCKQPAIPDERASSSVSSVSGPAATISRMQLNRVNSRVAASNMLRTLRREVGRTRVEYALDRRFSGPFRAGSTIGTLPDLLRVYAASPRHSSLVSTCIEEEPPSNINADSGCVTGDVEMTSYVTAFPVSEAVEHSTEVP